MLSTLADMAATITLGQACAHLGDGLLLAGAALRGTGVTVPASTCIAVNEHRDALRAVEDAWGIPLNPFTIQRRADEFIRLV